MAKSRRRRRRLGACLSTREQITKSNAIILSSVVNKAFDDQPVGYNYKNQSRIEKIKGL
jgi:hypothetical protein